MLRSGTIRTRLWCRSVLSRRSAIHIPEHSLRSYCKTTFLLEEDVAAAKKEDAADILLKKQASRDFNNRRAIYRRQVSRLRREYADEVAEQRAADKAEQDAIRRELTRKRLERQRRKNIRSAQNAMRQKELREQREREFNEHLRIMQLKRDATEQRYNKARQMVIDELEEEAPLWMTTPEEVEAAFTPEAEQLLWGRRGGVLGAPNPSLDCHFWQYETHTWHMDKTYKSMREVLLEDIEEMAYEDANVDKSFWTPERVKEQVELEERARLRAMVHSAGRIELLKKQKQFLDEQSVTEKGDIPKPESVPSLGVLRNDRALEKEGAKLLMEDPTKFFVFENSPMNGQGGTEEKEEQESAAYSGPTLGSPIGLRDPLREGSHQNRVFPYFIGKLPKPDRRTEREKKLQEREQRMWEAAQAEAAEARDQIEAAAEEQSLEDLEPDIDYDKIDWDSDDEEWKQGLDPEADAHILNTPRERRYSEEDIEWVVEQLQGKVNFLEKKFEQDMEGLKRSVESQLPAADTAEGAGEEKSLEATLLSMPEKELMALSDLDDSYTEDMSDEELSKLSKNIPSLTEEQIRFILNRDRSPADT